MSAVSGSDVFLPEPFAAERTILREHRHNVLLEGPSRDTHAVLGLLQPHLREPVVWHRPPTALDLPGGEARALVLRDVTGLGAGDQKRLLAWLGSTGSRAQVVSTSERSTFALVAEGLFDEALYYRLNVMLIRVASTNTGDGRRTSCTSGATIDVMDHV